MHGADPDNQEYRRQLAQSLKELGDLRDSSLFTIAAKMPPMIARALSVLGEVLLDIHQQVSTLSRVATRNGPYERTGA